MATLSLRVSQWEVMPFPSNLLPNSGDQPPVHTKTTPVPADDGFRRDDEEGLFPSRPEPPDDYPEELIEGVDVRARMSTLQRDELLTQSEILEKETLPPAKEAHQRSEAEPEDVKHGPFIQALENNSIFTPSLIFNVAVNMAMR